MKTIQLFIAILLFPLSIWYAVGVAVRNWLYDVGIKKTARSPIPTIGIGNLRMGGTGKTPHTEYLIRHFSGTGTSLAILSRGYGRKTEGFVLSDSTHPEASTIGDEPAMLARKFPGLTVAVCQDRNEGIRQLQKLPHPPQLILLDDVYQHRSIRPNVMMLLTEYNDLFCNDHILPFGNLREARRQSRRADIVVVTKCPPLLSERKREKLRHCLKLQAAQSLFFSSITYLEPRSLFGNGNWQPVREVLLVTGIAHPAPLKHHLERQCTVRHLSFPDHHAFTDADIRQITKAFNAIKEPSKAIVTTEKDAMRLISDNISRQLSSLPVFFVPISITFNDEEAFLLTIKKFI